MKYEAYFAIAVVVVVYNPLLVCSHSSDNEHEYSESIGYFPVGANFWISNIVHGSKSRNNSGNQY